MAAVLNAITSFFSYGVNYETRKNGKRGSIVSYDLSFLITFGWYFPKRGSIFRFYELLGVIAMLVVPTEILAYYNCANDQPQSLCIKLPAASTSYLTLMTLCSFVVAFFANTVLQRWWTTSQNIQALFGSSKEGMVLVLGAIAGRLSGESMAERARLIQEADKLTSYLIGIWLFGCKLQMCAGRRVSAPELHIESEFFTLEEKESILALNGGKPSLIQAAFLLSVAFNEACARDVLANEPLGKQFILDQLMNGVKALRVASSNISQLTDIQLPLPFIQLVCAVVYAFSVQLIIVCAAFLSKGEYAADENNGYSALAHITLVLYGGVLFGMLKLLAVLENPVGEDGADLPTDSYYADLKKLLVSLKADGFARFRGGSPYGDNARVEFSF